MTYKPLKITVNKVNIFGKPKLDTKEVFVWQCAYIDAFAKPHVLHGYIWDSLCGYRSLDGSSLYKVYDTEEDAVQSLKRAVESLKSGLKSYDYLLH